MMGNLTSLENKMEELGVLRRKQKVSSIPRVAGAYTRPQCSSTQALRQYRPRDIRSSYKSEDRGKTVLNNRWCHPGQVTEGEDLYLGY